MKIMLGTYIGMHASASNAKGHINMKDSTTPVMTLAIAIRKERTGSPAARK
jgi:hypothetical protein